MHTPQWLIDAARAWCKAQSWTLGIDTPYAGSIVPMKHFQRDPRVLSIMIEINRVRYMTLRGDEAIRSSEFERTKEFVTGFVSQLRKAAEKL